MGKIFYGLAGEGRGHATRVRTIVEDLKHEHEIIIYAPADAWDFLEPIYRNTGVTVRKIPGLHWQYDMFNRLNYPKSVLYMFQYLAELNENVDTIARDIDNEKPDLVITDFDPLLPRAAQKTGVRFISVNHQHFLVTYDLSSLPVPLKVKADIMAQAIPLFYSGQEESVVSSFYFPPLRKDVQNVTQVGVLLRKEVRDIKPVDGDHLVVYLRKFTTETVMDSLKKCGMKVLIYGLGKQEQDGNITYRDVDPRQFIEDLASSSGLVSTAGNQVVGEALYLGKPVLAMPEPNNFEQEINGHFLKQSGCGISVEMDSLNSRIIKSFIDNREIYTSNIDRNRLSGNRQVLDIINSRIYETQNQQRKVAV